MKRHRHNNQATGGQRALATLEILREFAAGAVKTKTRQQNLMVNETETPNLRLWAIREKLAMDEKSFARQLGVKIAVYRKYERLGNFIPRSFLDRVAQVLAVPRAWLFCRQPFFPLPRPDRSISSRRCKSKK